MTEEQVDVLIVGGGPVGLATALFLGRHGVRSLLAERHTGTTIYPRATGIALRTWEFLREAELDEAVLAAGSTMASAGGKVVVDTLAGTDLATADRVWPRQGSGDQAPGFSPVPSVAGICPQDRLEPILLDAARGVGAQVRFGTEVTDVDVEAGTARVGGQRVRFRYAVAADGAGSGVRERLGITTSGPGPLGGAMLSVLVRVDLADLVRGHEFVVCEVRNPASPGLLLSVNNVDRWVFHISYRPEEGQSPDDYPPERCVDLVRAAVGVPDLDVELLARNPWVPSAFHADRMRHGPVFLTGDAAHVMPPLGAYGLNTGLADAHNLAWKLAMVLTGRAGDGLLDTYEAERLPVARFTVDQALLCQRNPQLHWDLAGSLAEREALGMADPLTVSAGYQYASSAVLGGRDGPVSLSRPADNLDGHPGSRVPHLWVDRRDKKVSTLDLCGRGFTLLGGPDAGRWREAAAEVGRRLGLAIAAYRVGPRSEIVDADDRWPATAGIGPDGAVLVRPDGFVAWRVAGRSATPERTLEEALRQILDR